MKKLSLILSCAILASGSVFAQKSAVSQAEKDINSLTPNYKAAREALKGALTNPETKDDVKTWYLAGKTEFKAYDQMLGENQVKPGSASDIDMANAIYDGNKYLIAALPMDSVLEIDKKTGEPKLDKNGNKKYKTKYTKEMKSMLFGHINDYSIAGSTFYNEKDYKKAQELWKQFVDLSIAAKGQKDYVQMPDSIIGQLCYYQGVAAYTNQDYADAIKALEMARNYDYDVKDTYDFALVCYSNLQDNDGIIKTAKLAFPKFGKEDTQYVSILINDYINNEKLDDAMSMLDEAIASNPDKAEFYDVKGTICEQMNNMDQALANFQKAIEVDPSYAKGQFNVGRYYYNLAVKKNDEASSDLNTRQLREYFETQVKPLYEQALPYMEKAYKLDPENGDIKYALTNLYYQLGDETKLKAIEGK